MFFISYFITNFYQFKEFFDIEQNLRKIEQ